MKRFKLFEPKEKEKKKTPAVGQLSNLVEILQDGVCIVNLSGEMIYMNSAGYKLLGLASNTEIDKYNFFEEIIKDEDTLEQLKKIINRDGLVNNYELKLYTFDNKRIEVILNVNFLNDYRQQTIGFLFLFKDITEIKRIQHQLLQTQKLESVGLMASGIAHDFNNILAAIIPNAELIKMTTPPGSENFTRAEIIESSALRASDIARKLLTFTRDNEHERTTVQLNKIIKESADLIKNSLPDSVELEVDLDDDLHSVTADATQIQQVVMNLIINAKDALPKGGVIRVKTMNHFIEHSFQQGTLEPGHYVKIVIEDNGTGIPFDVLPKIFDPFFTTKDVGKGTGLGLSMVYGIIKNHNGATFVNSVENEGTRFEILLPAEEQSIEGEKESLKVSGIPKGLRILIVDDEPYVRDILSDILKYLGCKVIKAENGKQAVELFSTEKDKIDYAVIDLRMPKMDGLQAIAELEKINPELKFITTSGFDDRSIELEKKKNVVGFLPKPYSLKSVSNALNKFIHNGS